MPSLPLDPSDGMRMDNFTGQTNTTKLTTSLEIIQVQELNAGPLTKQTTKHCEEITHKHEMHTEEHTHAKPYPQQQ